MTDQSNSKLSLRPQFKGTTVTIPLQHLTDEERTIAKVCTCKLGAKVSGIGISTKLALVFTLRTNGSSSKAEHATRNIVQQLCRFIRTDIAAFRQQQARPASVTTTR